MPGASFKGNGGGSEGTGLRGGLAIVLCPSPPRQAIVFKHTRISILVEGSEC